ncbi:MAG: MFS transporter [Actinobacteria bacterium]|nr:MFS transporter [Actinomycetota bacterium]
MTTRSERPPGFFDGPSHKWWALGATGIGVLMSTFNAGVVSVGLPTIMGEFKVDVATIQWVLLAFSLVVTITLLPFGRLADMHGRKKVYTAGFVIFTLGSALCAAATSAQQLILFRVVQALGASMLMANGMAITSAVFPPAERGMALGINGAIVATGVTVGPSVGGVLTEWFGWRSVFYMNIPVGIIGVALALLVLRDSLITPTLAGKRPDFDYLGALIAGAGLMALMIAFSGVGQVGLSDSAAGPLYIVAAVAFVAFIFTERRVAHPMTDLGLFRIPLFALGSATALLSFLAMSVNAFLLPFYLQLVLNFPPAQAGLLMTPTWLIIGSISPFSGWLSDRMGARLLASIGLAIGCLSLYGFSRLDATSGYGDVLIWLIALGVGQGLFQSPNSSSVIGAVPRERYGVASGFLSMMRNLGMVVGTALSTNLLMSGLVDRVGHVNLSSIRSGGSSGDPLLIDGFMTGMERAYFVAAIIAAAAIVASLSRGAASGRSPAVEIRQVRRRDADPAFESAAAASHPRGASDGRAQPSQAED